MRIQKTGLIAFDCPTHRHQRIELKGLDAPRKKPMNQYGRKEGTTRDHGMQWAPTSANFTEASGEVAYLITKIAV